MFYGCENLKGGQGTPYDGSHIGGEYARADGLNSRPGYFTAKRVTVPAKGKTHDCPSAHLKNVDVNAWYHEYVDYVVEKGLMQGVADDLFAPEVTTSRAMIVTIFYGLEGRPAVSGASPYDDVPEGKWYTDAVKWARENEIVAGYGGGKFGPDDLITREQFAAILMQFVENVK